MEPPVFPTQDTKAQVNPNEPFNITEWFEQRNTALAVREIVKELQEYLAMRSNAQDPSRAFCADGYYWICVGDISLSKAVKNNIRQQFITSDGQGILFKNWKQITESYPEITNARNLRGKTPAFVGLPLPKEETE